MTFKFASDLEGSGNRPPSLIESAIFLLIAFFVSCTEVYGLESVSMGRKVASPYLVYNHFPKCSAKDFISPAKTTSGGFLTRIESGIYCTIADLSENIKNRGADEFFSIFSGRRPIRRISIYSFAAIERRLVDILCERSAEGVAIDMVVAEFESDPAEWSVVARRLRDCLSANQGSVRQYPLGGGIISFHPKFYRVDYHDGESIVVVGSGHPQRGLTITFDHWVFFSLASDDPFLREHDCFVSTLDYLLDARRGPIDGYLRLNICRSVIGNVGVETRFFFLPFDHVEYRSALQELLSGAQTIDIAMTSVGSEWVLYQLLEALRRGATVRVVAEDDAYWVSVAGCSECKATDKDYSLWLAVLSEWGAQVRFVMTNHTCGRHSRMHHKIVLFKDGAKEQVGFGSANFTDPAIGGTLNAPVSGNIENAYLSSDSSLVEPFRSAFEKLWTLGVPVDGLPVSLDSFNFKQRGC